ncbi:MAG: twin-arginine translocation signal domain-containing protein, partial [Rhodospirillales bacterium]|nr:twin-arginine translocation signal domain-containing protein [Rhodospirillales bacterium]
MTQREDDPRLGALTRRDMLKTGAAAGVSVAVAGGLSVGMTQMAYAASDTIRGYGTTTVQLKDWSLFTNSTGLTMEFTPTDANMGNFMRDV